MSRRRLTQAADAARGGILCVAAASMAAGNGSAAMKSVLVLAPALAGRLVGVHPGFDLAFTLALMLEAAATALGAHDSITWGDTISHTVLPLLSGPVLYAGLVRLDVGVEPTATLTRRASVGAAVVTATTVLALGALWELVEWAADSAVGTTYSQGYSDTLTDLLNDAISAAGSGLLVALWLRMATSKPDLRLVPGNRAVEKGRTHAA